MIHIKRVLGISDILFFIIFILFISSCSSAKEEADFASYDVLFADSFFANQQKEKKIEALTAYYMDSWYYYDVLYVLESETDVEDVSLELVYIFRYRSLNAFFNIQDEASCLEYFYSKYTAFKTAVEKGISRQYSDVEILKISNASNRE